MSKDSVGGANHLTYESLSPCALGKCKKDGYEPAHEIGEYPSPRMIASGEPRPAATGHNRTFTDLLLDHPVGAQHDRLRNPKTDCLCGSAVYDELQLRGPLHRQISGPCTLQNFIYVHGSKPAIAR